MKPRLRPHHAQRFRTAQPHGEWVTTLPVPGFRQTRDYTCGFASALMVMHYYAIDLPAMALFRRLGTDRHGTRQNAIIRELRAVGLRANARHDVDLTRIGQAIDRNKLIVGYLEDLDHWLVIYGYGHTPNRVFVADPRPHAECEQPWDEYGPRLGGFGIICSHPRDSAVVRQTPLGLREPDTPATIVAPPPVSMLRCEVRQAPPADEAEDPVQLSFSFCA